MLCNFRLTGGALTTSTSFHTSAALLKIIPKTLKGRSKSSQDWLTRQLNDPYVKMARYRNYRARSAFKLIEIDDKHQILEPGMTVVECGACPGAWTQVLVERLHLDPKGKKYDSRGKIISIDINPMSPVEGATVLSKTDFTKAINQAKILNILDGQLVDLVLSDMAPNATGTTAIDHQAIVTLAFSAFSFALPVLKPQNGAFIAKLWDNQMNKELRTLMEKFFGQVFSVKPPASRDDSTELYLIGKKFKGIRK